MKPFIPSLFLSVATMLVSTSPMWGAMVTQTNLTPNTSTDWNTASMWSNSAVPSNANTYVGVAGGTLNVTDFTGFTYTSQIRANNAGATDTFGGASLTVPSGERLVLKTTAGQTSTANLVLSGSSVVSSRPSATTSGTSNLAGTISTVSGTTSVLAIMNDSGTLSKMDVKSSISGSGNLDIFYSRVNTGTTANNLSINLSGDISLFTGNITVSPNASFTAGLNSFNVANFAIRTDVVLNSTTLTLNPATGTSSNLNFEISNTITVASLIIGSTPVTPGTYTASSLTSGGFGSGITFSGVGSITVTSVPEPSTWGLLTCGLLFTVVMIRRRTATTS